MHLLNSEIHCAEQIQAGQGKWLSVATRSGEIEFKIDYADSYPENVRINVKHTVNNLTEHYINIVVANGIYDLRIALTAPSGKKIPPYPYSMSCKRYTIGKIPPGSGYTEEMILADYFPFDEVGEYKCNITRRVYDVLTMESESSAAKAKEMPIDLVAPEFSFRVGSLKHIAHASSPADEGKVHGDILDGITPPNPYLHGDNLNSKHPQRNIELAHPSGVVESSKGKTQEKQSQSRSWLWLLALPVIILAWLGFRIRKNMI